MIRERLALRGAGAREGFRFRGLEVSRLEGFSDAVFGFSPTLLVVSLEVPDTFDELIATMRGFVAFGWSVWWRASTGASWASVGAGSRRG